MNPPKPGDRISEYVLLEQVGAGSFGEVWKARHHIWHDQIVAVKIATDAQYVRNLQKEGVTIHGLRHPNIVRAIGLDPYAGPPYLVMEFIDGPSLQQVIEAHPTGLPMEAVLAVLRGMLLALQAAHENGVIHRDIKPANVLIASRDDVSKLTADAVRITDFGLGQAERLTTTSILQSGSLATEDGKSISGTMAYMAPEQRDGLEVDARADLYACGVVLFEMVTGKRPQGGDLPSHLRPELPKWLDDFFARCYTGRERRFGSAAEMLARLDDHLKASQAPRAKPVPPLPRARPVSATPSPQGSACPQCGGQVERDDNFCIHCGHQINPHPRRCVKCGAYPDVNDKYCILCGGSLVSMGC
jgi:serine/threonine protein kinase